MANEQGATGPDETPTRPAPAPRSDAAGADGSPSARGSPPPRNDLPGDTAPTIPLIPARPARRPLGPLSPQERGVAPPRGLSAMTRNVRITLIALSVMFLIACCTLSWGAASAIFPPPGLPVAAASTAPSGSSTFSAAAIDQSTAAPGGDATPTASGGNSSPTPSDSATVTPTPSPPAATPTPTLTPTPSINPCANPYCNPWGYNFMPGSLIPNPNLAFCSVFPCVSKFWSQRGYVVECTNGLFAHDGGSLTVCGKPSNYLRTLFQHP